MLSAGSRLGVYEVTALIGVGGMGEVYRARDTRLKRDVALKVLPDTFAQDADRLARFQREAELLATLNHPHIAGIYGLEESDGVRALVLELVEGPTLADRIAKGPVPLDEALAIAGQIAEALEAAHEQGIIHRDLKPANINVREDGTIKVLDFGLAKPLEPAGARRANATESPTITSPPLMTGAGVILGTAAYMAPEQAKGREADKRSDLWAFGCVLYEMLAGKRAFEGEDVSDMRAAVLRGDPEWTALPADVPPAIRVLLRRCLEKDRRKRLADVAAVRVLLDEAPGLSALASSNTAALEHERAALRQQIDAAVAAQGLLVRRWRLRLGVVSAALIVMGAATTIVWYTRRPAAAPVTRATIATTGSSALALSGLNRDVALTPDGRRVVYVGNNGTQLFVRDLDTLAPTAIATGTNIQGPFVSPDGQWVGFSTGPTLWKVALTGGPPIPLPMLDGATRGAAWAPDGTVIVATTSGTGLQRMSAVGGGRPDVLTQPDREAGEVDHLWPELLPGGTAVLFTITSAGRAETAQIAVLDLQTGAHTILVRGGSHAHYVRSGHLIYTAAGTLHAIGFDLGRRETRGTAVPVVPEVATTPTGAGNVAVATEGTLVYVDGPGSGVRRTLVWVDRTGREEPLGVPPRAYAYPRLAPTTGRRLVVRSLDEQDDLWIWDDLRANLSRLTAEPGSDNLPLWTPDGQRIIFSSARAGGAVNLWWQAADGTGVAERLTTSPNSQFATAISRDGRAVVFFEIARTGGRDLRRLALDGSRAVTPLVETPADEQNGVLSPDGRWLAYESTSSGRSEIHVRPFSETMSGFWQISSAGGMHPLFDPRGTELFFRALDGAFMRVSVDASGTTWSAGTPTKLFDSGAHLIAAGVGRNYDLSPDGQRFLMVKAADAGIKPASIILVQHFDEELKRRVPTQ